MRFLLFLILARYAVRCHDESNYYVIEVPDSLRDYKKPFRVYWNVPTKQCKSKKIPFENLYEKYGIIQNQDDMFLGENVAILYDPGQFPALLKDEKSGKVRYRNGGVPQEGDLDAHLDAFRDVVATSLPDPDFSGIAIIDFESWRPVFRQNFGALTPYKEVSYDIEHSLHPWWPQSWIHDEAKQRFEKSGRTFMETTLTIAKQMRPRALWGYYGFPYCFNMASNRKVEDCPRNVVEENDGIQWLWDESTALYPSLYSSKDLSPSELAALIRGRVREASRLRRPGSPILPYFWYRYRDGGFLRKEDLVTALETLHQSNATGFIIWGSSSDVNTIDKCNKLKDYLESTFGPYISKYTKNIQRYGDNVKETENPINGNILYNILFDPQYTSSSENNKENKRDDSNKFIDLSNSYIFNVLDKNNNSEQSDNAINVESTTDYRKDITSETNTKETSTDFLEEDLLSDDLINNTTDDSVFTTTANDTFVSANLNSTMDTSTDSFSIEYDFLTERNNSSEDSEMEPFIDNDLIILQNSTSQEETTDYIPLEEFASILGNDEKASTDELNDTYKYNYLSNNYIPEKSKSYKRVENLVDTTEFKTDITTEVNNSTETSSEVFLDEDFFTILFNSTEDYLELSKIENDTIDFLNLEFTTESTVDTTTTRYESRTSSNYSLESETDISL